MKIVLIAGLLAISIFANAQDYVVQDNDSTVKTEYNDGRLWAYRQIGDFIVGMTNYVEKNNYGKYYQMLIYIKNLSDTPILFDPSLVTTTLLDKHNNKKELKVYTYEQFLKKIKKQQAWTMALTGFAAGMNAGSAGYQTTYTTTYRAGHVPYTQVHTTYNYATANAANMAASTQIVTLGRMMNEDTKTISQGYLKLTTIHPGEGIIGYMNIKYRKGVRLTINIPFDEQVYSFDWDVEKK